MCHLVNFGVIINVGLHDGSQNKWKPFQKSFLYALFQNCVHYLQILSTRRIMQIV
ncbi:Uncharacterized protein APZ42_019159 [Daphnia magna]|uniref:Uncharacterized protein n=1 Tax=Daphnia magna TaxID=35525 RepID=A0A162CP84_9CRUS|nr:Uncharacterized protein APZ42_019159 [Daphnia magna]